MGTTTDVDYFKVRLPAGKTLTAKMTPNATSDYDVELQNSAGTKLTRALPAPARSTPSPDEHRRHRDDLYVKVYHYSGGTGATSGKYSLVTSW